MYQKRFTTCLVSDRQTRGSPYLQDTIRKIVCASKHSALSHVMKLLGQTMWNLALNCALLNRFCWLGFCFPATKTPTCEQRKKQRGSKLGWNRKVSPVNCPQFTAFSTVFLTLLFPRWPVESQADHCAQILAKAPRTTAVFFLYWCVQCPPLAGPVWEVFWGKVGWSRGYRHVLH